MIPMSRYGLVRNHIGGTYVDIAGADGAAATGRSKREAEQNAATRVLVREGLWKDPDA